MRHFMILKTFLSPTSDPVYLIFAIPLFQMAFQKHLKWLTMCKIVQQIASLWMEFLFLMYDLCDVKGW